MDGATNRPKPDILIAIAEGCAYAEGRKVDLTPREYDVLTAIALSRKPISTDVLLERVWPEQDPELTRLRLKVYVHRLRRRLGGRGVVICNRHLWTLCPGARVDVLEWQSRARFGSEALTAAHAGVLRTAYETLVTGIPEIFTRSALFEQVDQLVRQVLCDVGMRLVDDAMQRGVFGRALALIQEITAIDPDSILGQEKLTRASSELARAMHSAAPVMESESKLSLSLTS